MQKFLHKIEQITTNTQQLEKNKSKTILIVDDSFVIPEQFSDLLSERYYTIEIARNSSEALDIINNKDGILSINPESSE